MTSVEGFDGYECRHNVEIIFSHVDGHVWASWPGSRGMTRLGSYDGVVAMMRDFLAQCDLADRLTDRNWSDAGSDGSRLESD